MAFEEDVLDISLLTVTDLSALQYYFVTLSADNTVEACDAAADNVIGVLQNKPKGATGVPAVARVRVLGLTRVMADTSAGVAYGDLVGTNDAGEAVAKVADKDRISGMIVVGASGGDTAVMLIYPPRSLSHA
jgi:hypothetical protein